MNNPKKLRGKALDEALDALLTEMISAGYKNAPISRTFIQQQLGLTSRATLVGPRGDRIDQARDIQLRESGSASADKHRRRTLEERIQNLEQINHHLKQERDQLYEALCSIITACEVRGLDVESVLSPLRNY